MVLLRAVLDAAALGLGAVFVVPRENIFCGVDGVAALKGLLPPAVGVPNPVGLLLLGVWGAPNPPPAAVTNTQKTFLF